MNRVKEYLQFLREANRPIYDYEKKEVKQKLQRLESKLSNTDIQNITLLSDMDLCGRYNLELRDINPKYVNVDMSKPYTKVTVEKTDFIQMKTNIINQIGY